MNPTADNTLMDIQHLKMYFPVTKGLLRRKVADVKAVDDVTFSIKKGEHWVWWGRAAAVRLPSAAVSSGCCPTEGQIIFNGQDIAKLPKNKMRPLRRNMQLIFQDPYGSLDPRQSAGSIVGESLQVNKIYATKREYEERVDELFTIVGLNPEMTDRYPHEFSGGQRQRIGIARALACDPSLIVCDEPISALDVSIQAQIINLLQELQEKLGLTYLFIAHDLSVVRHISDRVAVMYLGHIVEITDWKELYENPLHPYTKALLSAVPIPHPLIERKRHRIILKGEVPSPLNPPPGCTFHPRCSMATKECSETIPELRRITTDHEVSCFRV